MYSYNKTNNNGLLVLEDRVSGLSEKAPPQLLGGVYSQNINYPVSTFPENELTRSNRSQFQRVHGVVGVHWLQGTIPQEKIPQVLVFLESMFTAKSELMGWGRLRYDSHYLIHPFNICLYFDSDAEKTKRVHNGRVCVAIPGDALDFLNADELYKLIKTLVMDFGFSATRCDVLYDDYKKRKLPKDIYQEAIHGNLTGFRRYEPRFSACDVGQEAPVTGVYFGTRGKSGSGKFLRIYDKEIESEGRIPAVRYEFETSKDWAKTLVHLLALSEDVEIMAGRIAAFVGGQVDFIDRTAKPNEKNLDRIERLKWWAEIIEELGEIKLRNPQKIKTVDKAIGWVEKSVSASLGMLREALGESVFYPWLFELVDNGKDKINCKQRQIILKYRQQQVVETQ